MCSVATKPMHSCSASSGASSCTRTVGRRFTWHVLEDVQQEAFALLLAERSGARVPDVLVVGSAGPGTAVLATRQPEGTGLVDLVPAELTDEVLRAVWSEVRLLHRGACRARSTQRRPRASHP